MRSFKTLKNVLGTLGTLSVLVFSGCEQELDESPEKNEALMNKLKAEIKASSETVTCEDGTTWRFMPIGAKPCGGPSGYVTYSTAIDTNEFIRKVRQYTEAAIEYNKATGAVSDCSVVPRPTGIVCENGKPVLIYKTN